MTDLPVCVLNREDAAAADDDEPFAMLLICEGDELVGSPLRRHAAQVPLGILGRFFRDHCWIVTVILQVADDDARGRRSSYDIKHGGGFFIRLGYGHLDKDRLG